MNWNFIKRPESGQDSIVTSFCEKGDGKKRRKKNDGKKRQKKSDEKTQEQYEKILAFMKPDIWYRANELAEVLGVKETRTKELLRALVSDKKLEDNGATKGKRYKKR